MTTVVHGKPVTPARPATSTTAVTARGILLRSPFITRLLRKGRAPVVILEERTVVPARHGPQHVGHPSGRRGLPVELLLAREEEPPEELVPELGVQTEEKVGPLGIDELKGPVLGQCRIVPDLEAGGVRDG